MVGCNPQGQKRVKHDLATKQQQQIAFVIRKLKLFKSSENVLKAPESLRKDKKVGDAETFPFSVALPHVRFLAKFI